MPYFLKSNTHNTLQRYLCVTSTHLYFTDKYNVYFTAMSVPVGVGALQSVHGNSLRCKVPTKFLKFQSANIPSPFQECLKLISQNGANNQCDGNALLPPYWWGCNYMRRRETSGFLTDFQQNSFWNRCTYSYYYMYTYR